MKKILVVLLMLLTVVGCAKEDPPIINVTSEGAVTYEVKCDECGKELLEDEANIVMKDMGSWTAKYHFCDDCFYFIYDEFDGLAEIEEDWSDISYEGGVPVVYDKAVTPGGVPVQTQAISLTININCDEGIKAKLYMNGTKAAECNAGGTISHERIALDQVFKVEIEAETGYAVNGFEYDKTSMQVLEVTDTSFAFRPLKNTTFTITAKGIVLTETELDTDKPKIRTTTSSAAYNSFSHSDPDNMNYSFLIGRTYYMVRQGEYIKGTITAKGAYKFDRYSYYEAYYVELDHALGSGWFYFDGDIKFANRIDESDVINIMYTDEEELDTLDPTKPLDVKAAPKGWEKDNLNVTYVCKDCDNEVDLDNVVYYLSSDDEYSSTMVATYWCENCQTHVFVKAQLGN